MHEKAQLLPITNSNSISSVATIRDTGEFFYFDYILVLEAAPYNADIVPWPNVPKRGSSVFTMKIEDGFLKENVKLRKTAVFDELLKELPYLSTLTADESFSCYRKDSEKWFLAKQPFAQVFCKLNINIYINKIISVYRF